MSSSRAHNFRRRIAITDDSKWVRRTLTPSGSVSVLKSRRVGGVLCHWVCICASSRNAQVRSAGTRQHVSSKDGSRAKRASGGNGDRSTVVGKDGHSRAAVLEPVGCQRQTGSLYDDSPSAARAEVLTTPMLKVLIGAEARMKEMYRGYAILYHPSDDWLGFIYPPGETEARGEPVRTTRAEGAVALLQKARARIDHEIGLTNNRA
jgi:hypothetical protein